MTSRAAHQPDGQGPRAPGRRSVARGLAAGITLARPGTALADAVPFAVGGLAVAHPRLGPVLLLALAGTLLSAAGRLLDAVACLGADQINPDRQGSALVRGAVGRGPLAGLAALGGAAVAAGGLLAAPTVGTRLGFVGIVALRGGLAWLRGAGGPLRWLRWPLVSVTLAGGLPLGVLATGGRMGAATLALSAAFGLGATVAGATVADLRDLPTDRLTHRRTAALASGVRLRRPSGFVLPAPYVALVYGAPAGARPAGPPGAGTGPPAGPGGGGPAAPDLLAASPGGPAAPGGGLGLDRAVAAVGALAAGLAGTVRLVRLIRSGAPGLDPIRSARARGGGFVRLNLLAVHLACVGWLLADPGGRLSGGLALALGVALLAGAAGWSFVLARWSAAALVGRDDGGPRPGPDHDDRHPGPGGGAAG
ncbi:4-hydroxybenzoate polyprenyltransferase [Frankia sp. AgB32]|uniref:4-hydroxybenzoate polyprenyltransferase n=1 Tax=Frankia sp. AgB32 TaxID=631119 RepID=UPI00200EB85A|nr:4-hydroxybenzoate polyprenyltransferase [Frankia sp. AgB32]MCK9894143.1 4-hydroxybenzoate polyprenyltransferase [Frankia sp. AgB32]